MRLRDDEQKRRIQQRQRPISSSRCHYCWLLLVVIMLTSFGVGTTTAGSSDTVDHSYDPQILDHLQLFHHHPDVAVIGPNRFPRPTEYLPMEDGENEIIVPYLTPFHGSHRPEMDAVVAYAAEYPLSNYMTFIESLREAGFTGDIVLAVSPLDVRNYYCFAVFCRLRGGKKCCHPSCRLFLLSRSNNQSTFYEIYDIQAKKEDVWNYLTEPNNHIVIYTPTLTCYTAEREEVDSAKGGSRTCVADHLYGTRNGATGDIVPIADPRTPRTVQTLRYEVYWLMVQTISPHSWILLVDARDTVFQTDPFISLPRQTDISAQTGLLYFFGENVDATRLGISKQNRKWLEVAYGDRIANLLADKPTVCSGATMGEQVALEMYIRAMVAESDDTGVVLVGADQGFHNYLYYSHKLKNADAIHAIVVFDQGQGIVNNMGALRTKELNEWGNGKIVQTVTKQNEINPRKQFAYTVLNWDGTISPVVHQYDRHKTLSDYFYKIKTSRYETAYRQRRGSGSTKGLLW
jgi:hypothetical protein